MKGFIIINGLILLFVIMTKNTFKKEININYNRDIKRFTALEIPKTIPPKKGLYNVSERYGFRKEVLFFVLFTLFWVTWQIYALSNISGSIYRFWFILIGIQSIIFMFLALFEQNITEAMPLDKKIVIAVPVYNEAPESLLSCLDSIMRQTLSPSEIHIIDDGSKIDYSMIKACIKQQCETAGIYCTWHRQENQGKRHAQINAIKHSLCSKDEMIVVTVDSDGILSDEALEEGLKPFHDKSVQSVAGLVLSKQAKLNLLSKITDLIFSVQQLVERGALSTLGCVSVNSGAIAFYRYQVIEEAVASGYLTESFANQSVSYSDDSYLTLIALSMGKTVTQKSAVCFADMPVNFNHHYRQQLRWMRGSFIRGMWRIRFTPVFSVTFIKQLVGWMCFFSAIYIYGTAFINLASYQDLSIFYLFIPFVLMSYLTNIKYLKIKRNDMSFTQQLGIFLLSPLAFLWSNLVIRTIKLFAIFTLGQNQWGTRTAVEAIS